jgi:hypothetical protein
MWFSSLLGKRPSYAPIGRRHASGRKQPTYRPRLEVLEDRWLPSQIGLTVTSLADSGPGTLRAAIQTADAGSHSDKFTISFAVTGTIDLLSSLPALNNSIAIEGPGASSLTIEPAAGVSLESAIITEVDPSETTSLTGLTIANGTAGGVVNGGTMTVSGCALSGNSQGPFGGGAILNYGTLTASGCTVSGNSGVAGAISNNGGSMSISGCTISGNSADFGVGFGGGISNYGGTLTVSGCDLSGNTAGGGGGIFTLSGTLTVTGSTISGNSASSGGGIDNSGGLVTVSNSALSGNSATDGGAIASYGGTLTVSNSALSGNSATNGGAIFDQGTLTVRNSTLSGNTASDGGAIYNDAAGTLDVRGSTLTGSNSASVSGGAIYNFGTATLQQSTLSGNTAGSSGGGVFNAASGTLSVKDSTVLKNVAPVGADIYNLGALTQDDSTVGVVGP